MGFKIPLPKYKVGDFSIGDYSGFKYFTKMRGAKEKVCFLSGQDRIKPTGTKIELLHNLNCDPNLGPGQYTPLLPKARYVQKKRKKTSDTAALKPGRSSESLIAGIDEEEVEKKISKVEPAKKLDKSGLLWGSRRGFFTPTGTHLGPADTPILRYPDNILNSKPNKVPFNSKYLYTEPLTITSPGLISCSDQYQKIEKMKSTFGGHRELNLPPILCVKSYADFCFKCKEPITNNYFYLKDDTFLCQKCFNALARHPHYYERCKMTLYKQGRYCNRYHRHRKVKGYDQLYSNKKLFRYLARDLYHQQYTGRRLVKEGIPSKNYTETSTQGIEIYKSLLSHCTFNQDKEEWFDEFTFGSIRTFEFPCGRRLQCRDCKPAPIFFLPHTSSNRSIFNMA